MDLSRYIEAQNHPEEGYAVALREIRTSAKQSHWMWYVFPQLEGLGTSATARYFALSLEEALAYVRHPLLGPRLLEISEAVVARLNDGSRLITLMNSRIDVQKLVSCMTLVAGAAQRECPLKRLSEAAIAILRAAEKEGFSPCAFTADQLTDSL